MARRSSNSLIFDSLHLEGGLFVPAVLEKAARGEHSAQNAADYSLPKGLTLTDEQGRAFRIASALWKNFESVRVRRDVDAAQATVGFALEFLRDALGYAGINACAAPIEQADRAFPITAFGVTGRVPIVIAPYGLDLDEPDERFAVIGSGSRRRSAYQLAQQFLNASAPCTWALLTNGRQLRLVRDADTLTRPAFLEADLELILRDQRYADFAAVWRLFHSSRVGNSDATCIWDAWKREGQEQGERVRDGLRDGVAEALIALGTGFIEHRANEALRGRLQSGDLSVNSYLQQLLRLIYRFLFLFTAEERGLLHVADQSPAARQARDAYAQGYAFRRLRDRALRRFGFDRYGDLWTGVVVVFRALVNGESRLALPPLGGLFDTAQCPDLDGSVLENRVLMSAMRHLRWSTVSGQLAAIDYRNMDAEELGSVYESLLELVPTVDLSARRFGFVGLTEAGSSAGNVRKTTGSYYTPDALVQELIKSALDPVIAQKIADNPANPIEALLSLTVCDPSCGSGHFLLAAARRLAEKLAELRAIEGAVRPDDYRHALRTVASHCLYGVDMNPMAVELCRVALWLEAFDPGKPLGFLDNHIRCGDSLVGVMDFSVLKHGIPDKALDPCEGDDKTVARAATRRNREERYGAQDLFAVRDSNDAEALTRLSRDLDAIPDDSPDLIRRKKDLFEASHRDPVWMRKKQACDLWTAAFFQTLAANSVVITSAALADHLGGKPIDAQIHGRARTLALGQPFFHWPLEFPEVFAAGGFDVLLSNPPWERIKLQEQEFFAARDPRIATAATKAVRSRLIKELIQENPALHAEFVTAVHAANCVSKFLRQSERFPLTAVGDINTYAVFAETIRNLLAPTGRAGIILPTGIATDDTTKEFFRDLIEKQSLARLVGYENESFIFPAIANVVRFCTLTVSGVNAAEPNPTFAFFLRVFSQLAQPERFSQLTADDLTLLNPNTRTCPVFRTRTDAELTRNIYKRVPVFEREGANGSNPWGISFSCMIHMANDSNLFHTAPGDGLLPLYEGKLIWHFDHRFGSYELKGLIKGKGGRGLPDIPLENSQNTAWRITPQYWVAADEVASRLAPFTNNQWLIAFRDVTSAKLERSAIFTFIPIAAVGHKAPLLFVSRDIGAEMQCCLVANLNSLVFDFVTRQKLGGTSLSYFILKQLPVFPPSFYRSADVSYLVSRVIELVYTADDMQPLAAALRAAKLPLAATVPREPYRWDEARRALLRAELDAWYARAYGLTRDELRYILDPADVHGPDFPGETFRVLKEKETAKFGEYRTRRLVLEAWDKLPPT